MLLAVQFLFTLFAASSMWKCSWFSVLTLYSATLQSLLAPGFLRGCLTYLHTHVHVTCKQFSCFLPASRWLFIVPASGSWVESPCSAEWNCRWEPLSVLIPRAGAQSSAVGHGPVAFRRCPGHQVGKFPSILISWVFLLGKGVGSFQMLFLHL